ncbi:MAG: AIR synthase related protein, partial [Polyangiales bacterium]
MHPEHGTPWQRAGGTHDPEEAPEPREFTLIRRIERALGPPSAREVVLGIGDDCAVLDPANLGPGERLVWTVDSQLDGVHFRPELLTWEDVGFRATAAAASDLLAMGARPIAALVAWTIPPGFTDDDAEAIARG